MPDLNATPGAVDANSYATVVEADDYHGMVPGASVWVDADGSVKKAALMRATRLLDIRVEWTGAPAVPATQALLWPRIGMVDRNGVAIATNLIPRDLKYATSELARLLIAGDRTADNDIAVLGITGIKAGPVALSFKGGDRSSEAMTRTNMLPEYVEDLLVPSWYTEIDRNEVVEDSGLIFEAM